MSRCDRIGEYLCLSEIDRFLRDIEAHTKIEVETLFTVTSAIEQVACGSSVLETYQDCEFA